MSQKRHKTMAQSPKMSETPTLGAHLKYIHVNFARRDMNMYKMRMGFIKNLTSYVATPVCKWLF